MGGVYMSGVWEPNPGEEEQFIEAWKEFARWSSTLQGAGRFRLMRDQRQEGRFVSIVPWESMEALNAWKASPDFKPHMGPVQRHLAEFSPTELEVVATAEDGVVESE